MPNIPMWQAPQAPGQTLQPQTDPTMGNVPAQFGSSTQSYFDPKKLAALLQNNQNPPINGGNASLGNGQDTSQMTSQGYPVGGTGQMQNQQNFMGTLGGNGNPNASWMPSWFQGGGQ